MSELKPLPCPICGDKLKIHGPEDWKPTYSDPDSGGNPYSATCDCGFYYSNGSYDYSEFVLCLNRRAQPENSRQHALQTGVCPMCEDCPDGCPVETPKDSRNKMTNAQKIRAMGDEELAKIIASEHMAERIPFCQDKPECSRILEETEDCIPESMCVECVVAWLQSPAETEGTE